MELNINKEGFMQPVFKFVTPLSFIFSSLAESCSNPQLSKGRGIFTSLPSLFKCQGLAFENIIYWTFDCCWGC
ncbi:hypothetical protein GCM10009092_08170 [Bowmanella denitrificans]|uniref:Uncharacterized protein n=1 Tax=Bowmanella denitrificans TaxID=366582 RepID=A0ABP3GHZ1_9ALTE